MGVRDFSEVCESPGRAAKANQVVEATLEKTRDHAGTDEPRGPGYENLLIGGNDKRAFLPKR